MEAFNKDIIAIIYRYIHRSNTKTLHIYLKYQTRLLHNDLTLFSDYKNGDPGLFARRFRVSQLKMSQTHNRNHGKQWCIKTILIKYATTPQ